MFDSLLLPLVLNFVTGYYKKGNVVMKRGPIIRHYLKTWFIVDFLSTIPYSWFIKERDIDYWPDDDFDETAAVDDQNNWFFSRHFSRIGSIYLETDKYVSALSDFDPAQTARLMKLIRFIRVIKINQIFKLRKLIYRFEWFFFNDKIGVMIDFFKIFLFVFFFVHWLACIFFLISDFEIATNPSTWITLLNKEDAKSAMDVYIASASWSFTTVASVGYGDLYPLTNAEKVFGIFAMIISTGIFSYIVGVLSTLFDKND
jgi:hypothetical protein